MQASKSVIRRYTSPSCTLEITAQNSPLSRWAGQSLFKNLKFRLRFEDPKQPDDQHITLRGDRAQLESLREIVSDYVQKFLQESPEQFTIQPETPAELNGSTPHHKSPLITEEFTKDNEDEETISFPTVAFPEESTQIQEPTQIQESTPNNIVEFLPHSYPVGAPQGGYSQMRLQPQGLLIHELFLGSLANEKSGLVVPLSIVQLHDLANVLDDYSANAESLPSLGGGAGRPVWMNNPVVLGSAAAAVLVAVGITATALRMSNPAEEGQVASVDETQEQYYGANDPLLDVAPLPVPSENDPLTMPSLPNDLEPLPNLPTDEDSDLADLPEGDGVVPSILPPSGQLPGAGTMPNPAVSSIPAPTPTQVSPLPVPQRAQIPTYTPPASPPRPQVPAYSPPPVAPAPSPTPNFTFPQVSASSPSPAPSSSAPRTSNPPSSSAASVPPRIEASSSSPIPRSNNNRSIPTVPSLPNLPETAPPARPSQPQAPIIATSPASSGNGAARATTSESSTNNEMAATNPTAHLSEVKRYFEQRWTPPENLSETLEYILYINAEGALDRIIPVGQAAISNISRTKMPIPGEPFVSGRANSQVRLVLTPDGKVQTFAESR